MMTWLMRMILALGLLLTPGARPDASITVMGATSLLSYARAVVSGWARQHPEIRVAISGGGSYAGWYGLAAGHADIALSDLDLGRGAAVNERLLGQMPILFVANPDGGIESVTRRDLVRIFSGRVHHWQALGGNPRPIRLVARPSGSGARAVVSQSLGETPQHLAQIIQLSNGAVVRAVEETPGAIGYVEGDRRWPGVVTLRIGGQAYRPGSRGWPFYAFPRIYWRQAASPAVFSLVSALAQSSLAPTFGIFPRTGP